MAVRIRMMTSAAIGGRGFLQGSGGLVIAFGLFGAPDSEGAITDETAAGSRS